MPINNFELFPPKGVDFALNPQKSSKTFTSSIARSINPESLNLYYDLKVNSESNAIKTTILGTLDANLEFFKGIRDSLVSILIENSISLVIFPDNSYPGNYQVCTYLGIRYFTYRSFKDLKSLLIKYDSNSTLVIWEDPGNPRHRGSFTPDVIKKSYVFIDCAYRFPSLTYAENKVLQSYLEDKIFLAFSLSKTLPFPASSISFIVSKHKISPSSYPIKWNLLQAELVKKLFTEETLNHFYKNIYLKGLTLYRLKEADFLKKGVSVVSEENPCFITIGSEVPSRNSGGKLYPEEKILRLPLGLVD